MSESGVTRRDFVKTSALGLGATALRAAPMPAMAAPADPDLVAWWTFDEVGATALRDAVSGVEDVIEGPFKTARGVRTHAIRLDGFSTSVVRKAASAPKREGAFTIAGWVALAARPEIAVDGRRLRPGAQCRVGYRHAVDGTDLIVWLGLESAKTVRVTLTPAGA